MPPAPLERSRPNLGRNWKSAAYLFTGPEGSGRRKAASEIAKELLGRSESHPDLIRIVPDKSSPKVEKRSIRIEAIRDLIHRLSLKPFESERIVVIIEEAEKMPEAAANALLKTLEEPPLYVLFILISAAPDRLLPTIRSRCQRISFQLHLEEIRERLSATFANLQGDLLALFQEKGRRFTRASKLAEEISRESEKLPPLFELLKALWRDLLVFRQTGDQSSLLLPEAVEAIREPTERKGINQIFEEIDWIAETERAIEGNVNKTLALERLFSKLTS